jgi:hypothetical protein
MAEFPQSLLGDWNFEKENSIVRFDRSGDLRLSIDKFKHAQNYSYTKVKDTEKWQLWIPRLSKCNFIIEEINDDSMLLTEVEDKTRVQNDSVGNVISGGQQRRVMKASVFSK